MTKEEVKALSSEELDKMYKEAIEQLNEVNEKRRNIIETIHLAKEEVAERYHLPVVSRKPRYTKPAVEDNETTTEEHVRARRSANLRRDHKTFRHVSQDEITAPISEIAKDSSDSANA